jgi:acyl carrier protein
VTDDEVLSCIRSAVLEEIAAPPDAIVQSASAATIPGWDSLAHTRIIMNLEARLGVLIDMDATYQAETINDLIGVVRAASQA